MNLFLIGYRGTGKTTVARLVAERLDWTWVDADDEVERQAGSTIAEIFAAEGEAGFRRHEQRVVAQLAGREQTVIALGGGAILALENRQVIAAAGQVVWLTATPEELWRRISADQETATRRPNLTAGGGITEIIATLDQRAPLYRQCAQFIVDTAGKSPAAVADAILEQVRAE